MLIDAPGYSNRVEAKRNFASKNQARGNEKRRWHGTTRKCRVGDKGVTTFCSNSSCALCCIMRSSFDLLFFAKKTGRGRFGAGIYTSSTSSKFVPCSSVTVELPSNGFDRADTYSKNDCTSNWKAMLLNNVVVGRGCKMTFDNATLTKPPAGYDSVSIVR